MEKFFVKNTDVDINTHILRATILDGVFLFLDVFKDFTKMYIQDYLQFFSQETLGAPRPQSHLHEFIDG